MKNKMLLGGLLLAAALLLAPAVTAEAKEIKAGESIPLTAEYFPDEWFLSDVTWYDKNKDGALSPEETAAVNSLWIQEDLTDFSQVQYFTDLRELRMECGEYGTDYYIQRGVWAGNVLDLRAFPKLEKAELILNSSKAPKGSPDIQVQVSGMQHLKELKIGDAVIREPNNNDGSNAFLGSADLRNTPALETLCISDVKDVTFDAENHIKNLTIFNVKELPLDQIAGFTKLEYLKISQGAPHFTRLDLSRNSALRELRVNSISLNEIALAGAKALETVEFHGTELTELDVTGCPLLKNVEIRCPKLERFLLNEEIVLEEIRIKSSELSGLHIPSNKSLKELRIDCPKLKSLDVLQNKELQTLWLYDCPGLENLNLDGAVSLATLCVNSDQLTALDLGSNKALTRLDVTGNKIANLDLTKNTKLTDLSVESKAIKKLNLKKNTKLTLLGIYCKQLSSLDLSKNKNLTRLFINSSQMKSVDLSGQKKLDYLGIGLKKLKSLDALKLSSKETLTGMRISDLAWKTIDLSKFPKLRDVYLRNNHALTKVELSKNTLLKTLKIEGSSKLTKLDLSKNVRLKELEIHGSPMLTKLDLRKNKRLFDVNVSGNGLKAIYLSASKPDLTYFDCRDNKLTSVDLSNVSNSYRTTIWCDKNVKVKGYKGKVYH